MAKLGICGLTMLVLVGCPAGEGGSGRAGLGELCSQSSDCRSDLCALHVRRRHERASAR